MVTNQLSGRRPFGKKTAHAYALAFGYNEEFLLHGFGYLYADAAMNDIMLAKGKSEEERSAELLARESELAEKVKRLQDELEREKEESKKKMQNFCRCGMLTQNWLKLSQRCHPPLPPNDNDHVGCVAYVAGKNSFFGDFCDSTSWNGLDNHSVSGTIKAPKQP